MVWVGDGLKSRNEACVSVFDSVVQGGDAVWEGLRIYDGRVADLRRHLARMADSAKALAFAAVPGADVIRDALFQTLRANGMYDGAHVRLTLTRGEKVSSGMSPHLNQSGCTLIVLAEWKVPVYDQNGIRLITSSIRRNNPQFLDSKIHHNNLLNNILAKIEGNVAGVDDALMMSAGAAGPVPSSATFRQVYAEWRKLLGADLQPAIDLLQLSLSGWETDGNTLCEGWDL